MKTIYCGNPFGLRNAQRCAGFSMCLGIRKLANANSLWISLLNRIWWLQPATSQQRKCSVSQCIPPFGAVYPIKYAHSLLCLVLDLFTSTFLVDSCDYLSMSVRVASLALGQYNCPSATEATLKDTYCPSAKEATLKDMGKTDHGQTKTQDNNPRTKYTFHGLYCQSQADELFIQRRGK